MGEMTAKAPASARPSAWVDGEPASYDAAVSEAARRIGGSAAAVFAHLGTDVAGAREAALLAEHVGGVLDHAQSAALFADLDAVRETGAMLTTPLEAAVRADVVCLVGDRVFTTWPDLQARLLARPMESHGEAIARRVVWLPTSAFAAQPAQGAEIATTGAGVRRLGFLASLRARVKQRPIVGAVADIDEIAAILRDAKFGVAIWSAAELDPLAIEASHGLVRDLNETTRFSTLPLAAPDNALGVQSVCGWMTGFPLRTGFARGRPEHDPWRYDARRLVAAGEADCLIWVSSLEGGAAPGCAVEVALCALDVAVTARVRINVARPGVDHDAVLHDARVGGLVARAASAPAPAPTVAATLAAIRAQLGGAPC